jgi:hypothetical protein
MRDLYELFKSQWDKAPLLAHPGRCYECGKPAATILNIGGSTEALCECCAADLADAMLAEAV